MSTISSRRPYLIRALYDWVLDNDLTPHLLVAADAPGVEVPQQFVTEEGRITINVSPSAVRDLALGNELVSFSARFSGRSHNICIPPGAVLALYARENGEGMLLGEVEVPSQAQSAEAEANPEDGTQAESEEKSGASHLRVVK